MKNIEEKRLNPWASIWLKPRSSIKQVIDEDVESLAYFLAAVGGIFSVGDRLSDYQVRDSLGLLPILAIVVIGGAILGTIVMYVAAYVLKWTGTWFNGQATSHEVRYVYAWSNVPMLVPTVCWFVVLILIGPVFLGGEASLEQLSETELFLILGLTAVYAITYIWSLILFIGMLSEVQGISVWKALASVLIPWIVIVLPLALLLRMYLS